MANRNRLFNNLTEKDEPDATERMRKSFLESPYMRMLEKDPIKNALYPWLRTVEILHVEKLTDTTARAIFRFPVQHEYLNPAQNLHGGLAAAMYDVATTWTIEPIRKPGFWTTMGTTRTLNVTYMRPATEGEMLLMESEIVHAGKRLLLIRAELKRERDGAVISTCEHQKYNVDADVAKV